MLKKELLNNVQVTDSQLKEIIKNVLISSYDEQSFKIGEFLTKYRSVLENQSIEIPKLQKMYNLFYNVKDELADDGLIIQLKQGIYYLNTAGVEDYTEEETEDASFEDEDSTGEAVATDSETVIIGDGKSEVYLYYYPSYKALAKLEGSESFRCKIGSTEDHKKRFSTSQTDVPENRKIAVLFMTDFPSDLEKILHSALRIQGKQLKDTPGREWFLTNPTEVINLYNTIFSGVAA